MNERKYTAYCDDGHDHFQFQFWSSHRAGSEANRTDARKTHTRQYGRGRCYTIMRVQLEK